MYSGGSRMTRTPDGRFAKPPSYSATHAELRQCVRERMIDEAVWIEAIRAAPALRLSHRMLLRLWLKGLLRYDHRLAAIRSEFQRLAKKEAR